MCVFTLAEKKDIIDWLSQANNYIWAAFDGDRPVAYMKVTSGGETFVSDDADMLNLCTRTLLKV